MTSTTLLMAYKAAKYKNALTTIKTNRQTLLQNLKAKVTSSKELVSWIEDTLLSEKEHGQGFTWTQHDFLFFQTKGSRLRVLLEQTREEINKKKNFTLIDVLFAAEQDIHKNEICKTEKYLEYAQKAEEENFSQLSIYYYIKYIETVLEQDNSLFTAETFTSLRNIYVQIEEKLNNDSYLINILKYRIDEKHAECLFDKIKKETEKDEYNLNDIIGKSSKYIKQLDEKIDPLNQAHTEIPDLGNTKEIFIDIATTYVRFAVTNPLYTDMPKAENPFLWKKYSLYETLSRSTKDGGNGPFLKNRDPASFLEKHPYNKPATNAFIPGLIKSAEQQLHDFFYSSKQEHSIIEPKPFDVIKEHLNTDNNKSKSFLSRIYFWFKNIFSLHTDNEMKTYISNWIKENPSASKFPSILELAQQKKPEHEESMKPINLDCSISDPNAPAFNRSEHHANQTHSSSSKHAFVPTISLL